MADQFIVAYAKIIVDRERGIELQDVYFGGIGDTLPEAEAIARDCANNIRGGTILPRVLKLSGDGNLIDTLYTATERFEKVTANMIEADLIINRNRRKT